MTQARLVASRSGVAI